LRIAHLFKKSFFMAYSNGIADVGEKWGILHFELNAELRYDDAKMENALPHDQPA